MVATSLPRIICVCFLWGSDGPASICNSIRALWIEILLRFLFLFSTQRSGPFFFLSWWLKVFHSRSIFSLFSVYYLKNDERQRKEDGFTSSSPHDDDDDVFLFRPPNRSIDSDYFQQYIIRQQRTTIAPLGWTRFSVPPSVDANDRP